VRIGSVDVQMPLSEENLMDYSLSKDAVTLDTVHEVCSVSHHIRTVHNVHVMHVYSISVLQLYICIGSHVHTRHPRKFVKRMRIRLHRYVY
jgi:hypothetical protein